MQKMSFGSFLYLGIIIYGLMMLKRKMRTFLAARYRHVQTALRRVEAFNV